MEALDLTADRLRRIQEAATKMTNDSHARTDRRTAQAGVDVVGLQRPEVGEGGDDVLRLHRREWYGVGVLGYGNSS
ncbi:hypothetical protein [Streptomyces sp. NPDC047130]|uniref:hypothetical protein n=1 Tax=Streptomyces sp. NPDC047130 TaxID=3155261 RepID=UPI0033CBDE34